MTLFYMYILDSALKIFIKPTIYDNDIYKTIKLKLSVVIFICQLTNFLISNLHASGLITIK